MNEIKKIDLETLHSINLEKASNKEINDYYDSLITSIFDKINNEEQLTKEEISIMKELQNVSNLSKDYIKHNKLLKKNLSRKAGKILTSLGIVGVVGSIALNTFANPSSSSSIDFFVPDVTNLLQADKIQDFVNEISIYYGNLYNDYLPFQASSDVLGLGLVLSTFGVIKSLTKDKVETKRAVLELYATETYKNEYALKEAIDNYSLSK